MRIKRLPLLASSLAAALALALAGCGGGGGEDVDTTAPAKISNLAITERTISSMTLSWTAPGDDGTKGTAAAYEIHYSASSITEENWTETTVWNNGVPAPEAAGTPQTCVIAGLQPEEHVYFAIRTRDEAGNWSAVSNGADDLTYGVHVTDSFLDYDVGQPLSSPWTLASGNAATTAQLASNKAAYLSGGYCHYTRNSVATEYPLVGATMTWAANDICQYGLFARYINANNNYQLLICKGDGTLKIIRVQDGDSSAIGSVSLPAGFDYTEPVVLEFKLEDAGAAGTLFKGYLNGRLLISAQDNQVAGAGTIGFLILDGGVYVDDFKAYTP